MIIILGLGNPEKEYQKTRHNIGKEVVNFIYQSLKNNYSFSPWKKKGACQISKGKIGGQKVILAKNLTFMNNCGKCVSYLLNYFKIPSSHLVVIHDDYDIPLGKIKISQKRGSAGHKGIESIFQAIGTKNFLRIRVGIQNKKIKGNELDKFVLEKFSPQEEEAIESVKEKVLEFFLALVKKGAKKAISQKY